MLVFKLVASSRRVGWSSDVGLFLVKAWDASASSLARLSESSVIDEAYSASCSRNRDLLQQATMVKEC